MLNALQRDAVEIEPDFGFPSDEQLQLRYEFKTKGFLTAPRDENLNPIMPPEIAEIDVLFNAACARKSDYHREDTAEIPQRMLAGKEDVSVDDILALTNVFYWWNVDTTEIFNKSEILPSQYLYDVLKDLTRPQLDSATEAIHSCFSHCCRYAKKGTEHTSSAQECMARYAAKPKEQKYFAGRDDVEYHGYTFTKVMAPLLKLKGPDSTSSLDKALDRYNVKTLLDAGLDEIEASGALKAMQDEIERREIVRDLSLGTIKVPIYKDFREHLDGGGDLDSFIEIMVDYHTSSNVTFSHITCEFEDLPDDVNDWDEYKKRALARRYLVSNRDFFNLYQITYDWERKGLVPPYLYAFQQAFPSREPI